MPKKILPFPSPKTPDAPEPGTTLGSRVIVGMAGQRFAIDIYTKVSDLNSEPAPVVSMDGAKVRKLATPRK